MGSHYPNSPFHTIPENREPSSQTSDTPSSEHAPVSSSPLLPVEPGAVTIDMQANGGLHSDTAAMNGMEPRKAGNAGKLGRSSVNVASIVRRDSAALRKQSSTRSSFAPVANLDRYCVTGRVYHPEHLHGHRQYGDGPTVPLLKAKSGQEGTYPDDDGRASVAFDAPLTDRPTMNHQGEDEGFQHASAGGGMMPPQPPMPKWPANWQSAAFEAVSQKRSYILSPPEIYAEIAHVGGEKAKYSWYKLVLLSVLAGAYVGFGYTTALQVGGNMNQAPSNPDKSEVNLGVFKALVGAMGFPFAFTIIVVMGAELFTSMCAYTAAAWWEGKCTVVDALRMMFITWFGNFAGTALMVGFMVATNTYEDGKDGYLKYGAEHKVSDSWGATFAKGILANWLVGIATWMANAAQDMTGKFVGIWLPISAFAAIGYEHCIANQFVIPMAIARGASIDARHFVAYNLIPATVGNWVGGAFFISTAYAFIYGRTPPRLYAWFEEKLGRAQQVDSNNSSAQPLTGKGESTKGK
ncbi:Formate/nitrite transporter-domain-containing protein [Dunaliella salina]|uniref:Formate/nitrite transporter-domain-containing protein n=1 Tax=Dunaliella salina TaxID=3046 RepID=A0ABQ7H4R5_DUNSA|nr:Formate/nitrite transporter-domain-containing protein [Dunaliella salina]|eukprot:KAF5841851.1 Formate/nitrite transporter-domain-containing protein [Dunaliella salina]